MTSIMKGALLGILAHSLQFALAIQNPIISGFNPDPAVLRLGNEYFLSTSSFEFFPGLPIYKSTDLQNWELFSHALTRPSQIQLYGTPTSAGVWAPSLSYINGRVYLVCSTRWTYDSIAKVWPRIAWLSSKDMKQWSELTWADPWGIDPQLFQDPKTNRTYLNIMAPNDNKDRLWGISQCQIDLDTGRCVGPYRSLWNGTLTHDKAARPEGPKMFFRHPYYYLLIAEGGTDELHRASIARSDDPAGPWVPAPNNPLIYNGAYGFKNLTVQSTGHADFVDTPTGDWYATFLARRQINGSSPLGREAFLTTVQWADDWPILNNGRPILLDDRTGSLDEKSNKQLWTSFVDDFRGPSLHPEWYRLRTPYSQVFRLDPQLSGEQKGLTLLPNVFSLSDRDQPAALFRKQKSLDMTFTAHLRPIKGGLRYRQSIGVSIYLSEFQHQDLGVRQCGQALGLCVYTSLMRNGSITDTEVPLNSTDIQDLAFEIRATPTMYYFNFITSAKSNCTTLQPQRYPVTSVESAWLAFAPTGWFVFTGASFALFASGNGEPWPYDAPEVGFIKVEELYGQDYRNDLQ